MSRSVAWDDLRTFLVVSERGTIGAAAKTLGVNHSTVLRHVYRLEASFGERLFDRLPGGYALTVDGVELAATLAGVAEQIEAAQRRFGSKGATVSGRVRLTTMDTLIRSLLMPHLATFQVQHPEVDLEILVSNSFANLSHREADIAIRGSNSPPENLVGRRIGYMQTALYASRDYLERVGTSEDVSDYDWVSPDSSLRTIESAKWVQANVPPERVAVRCDSLLAVADAVSAGMGVGLVSCALGERRPELIRLADPIGQLDTHVWILTHPELRNARRIRALMDHLADQLRREPGLIFN